MRTRSTRNHALLAAALALGAVAGCGGDDSETSNDGSGATSDDATATSDSATDVSASASTGMAGATTTAGSDATTDAATDTGTSEGDASVYFVATDGDDGGSGSIDDPFATLEHAIGLVVAGDTIFVRGGTYSLSHSVVIDKAGAEGLPIRLWAYEDEIPVLDFNANPLHANPPQPRDDDSIAATFEAIGVFVAGGADWWHLKGLTIQNAAYYGVRVYGSHNTFEQLVLHDNKAAGLELTGKEGWSPAGNLVLNCDSFHNFDPQSDGEDADGFAAKFDSLGPDNVFRGTRAWSNADDGYDFWHAAPVLVDGCWAFDNGFNRPEWAPLLTEGWAGDGMGFKLGQEAGELVLRRVVAWANKGFGIDENGNMSPGGVTIYNATLVNNAKDGNPLQLELNDGRPHTVRNSIAFDLDGADVTNLDGAVDHASNSWNGAGATVDDFESLDMDALFEAATGPRGQGGSLPPIGLRLSPASALIDAGVDVGLPFEGGAPDLGAFESPGA